MLILKDFCEKSCQSVVFVIIFCTLQKILKGLTHSSKIANRLPQRTFTMKKIALYLIFAFSTIFATAQTRFDVDGLTCEILSPLITVTAK